MMTREENAKLKGEADSVLDNWCRGDDPCPHLKKRDEQLTKAKELLKTYKDFIEYEGLNTRLGNLYNKTKQFLKESE